VVLLEGGVVLFSRREETRKEKRKKPLLVKVSFYRAAVGLDSGVSNWN